MNFSGWPGANDQRTRCAAARDIALARQIACDARLADCPQSWAQVAAARAAHPESASWADIGEALGWTKDKAVGCWRRLLRSLGYAEWHPSDAGHTRCKDRSGGEVR